MPLPSLPRFNVEYVRAILKELDEAPHGEKGKNMRREGLYAKTERTWREQMKSETLNRNRGRKSSGEGSLREERNKLQRENARLKRKLEQAELIIEVQKQYLVLLPYLVASMLQPTMESPGKSRLRTCRTTPTYGRSWLPLVASFMPAQAL